MKTLCVTAAILLTLIVADAANAGRLVVVRQPVVVQRQQFVRQPVFVQRQVVRQPVVVQRQQFVRQPVFVQRQPVFIRQPFVSFSFGF